MKFKYISILALLLSSGVSYSDTTELPLWWFAENIVTESEDIYTNNAVLANVGQAKWVTTGCYKQLEALIVPELGFTLESLVPVKPTNVDDAWYAQQLAVLNLGQLKHLSASFYQRLNELAPQWVETQMELNGVEWGSEQVYPWDSNTPVSENYAPSNLGQLKSIFALRFGYDSDGDGNADLSEYILINDDPKMEMA